MDRLPEEILLRIFKLLVDDIEQLAIISQVSKRLYRILQDQKLWYICFQTRYPIWGSNVQYHAKQCIDWKDFMVHLMKQQKSTRNFSFEFVKEEAQVHTNKKRKVMMDGEGEIEMILDQYTQDKTPFWIQDPLVVDIDPVTGKGVVATGKHRKNWIENRSEHKILFWEYPSWKLMRSFDLNLSPPHLNCQIIGVQTITIPTLDGKSVQPVRFFSLAVGMSLPEIEHENEDRVDIWKSLFIYRLFNDGSTQCLSHIEVNDIFLGREIFLFSDTSWSNNSHNVKDWLNIISPSDAQFDSRFTVFILAIGPTYDPIMGCVQLAKFDLRASQSILDPSLTSVYWNGNRLLSKPNPHQFNDPTEIITSIKLGNDVSCMIHFKYPAYLNHLICTGSYQDDELSVYDWRFGIKVGTLPWKPITAHQVGDETIVDVRPWGLESTLVLSPYWTTKEEEEEEEIEKDLSKRGFRLIAVGDNRSDNARDKLEIKVWDISYLLTVKWDPFQNQNELNSTLDLSSRFSWWSRRTSELEKYAIHMMNQDEIDLPYSPPKQFKSILLSHTFDKDDHQTDANIIPVKYTAYNVLYTSLFLLTEDGKVTVMDIETGKITGTVENVASGGQQVRGIDVNVIGGKEVVVTSKEGLLRGIVN